MAFNFYLDLDTMLIVSSHFATVNVQITVRGMRRTGMR
jgi:hypothetical protein